MTSTLGEVHDICFGVTYVLLDPIPYMKTKWKIQVKNSCKTPDPDEVHFKGNNQSTFCS